jgi:hypothetical protein
MRCKETVAASVLLVLAAARAEPAPAARAVAPAPVKLPVVLAPPVTGAASPGAGLPGGSCTCPLAPLSPGVQGAVEMLPNTPPDPMKNPSKPPQPGGHRLPHDIDPTGNLLKCADPRNPPDPSAGVGRLARGRAP